MPTAKHAKSGRPVESSTPVAFELIYRVRGDRAALVVPKFGPSNAHAQIVNGMVLDYFGQEEKRGPFLDCHVGLVGCIDKHPAEGLALPVRGGIEKKIGHMLDTLAGARSDRVIERATLTDFGGTQFGAVADTELAEVQERNYLVLLDLDTDVISRHRDTTPSPPVRLPKDVVADLDKLPAAGVASYEPALEILAKYLDDQRAIVADRFAKYFHSQVLHRMKTEYPDDYPKKRAFAKWLGHELRRLDLAIRHPDTQQPCSLYALAGHDGRTGKFVLETRGENKKRTHTGLMIGDILPLQLVPDVVRREGVLGRAARS